MSDYEPGKLLFLVAFVAFAVCHTVAFVIACIGSVVETYKHFFS